MEDAMRDLLSKLDAIEKQPELPEVGDAFGISLSEDFEIATEIVGFTADGIVVQLDDEAQTILESQGVKFYEGYLVEEKQKGVDGKVCWKGYRRMGTKMKGGKRVDNCVKVKEDEGEGKYKGIDDKNGDRFADWMHYHGNGLADDWHTEAEGYDLLKISYDFEKGKIDFKQAQDRIFDLFEQGHDVRASFIKNFAPNKLKNPPDEWDSNWFEGIDESGLQYYTGKKKYGKEGMAALAKAGREGASEEELGRIKDKYKKEDSDIDEAEYQGKNVPLGKKLPGDVKKYKVYVRKPNGNVVKVNFGDKKMRIKKSNPARRKSFRARHNCDNPGPRHKARYWSCRNW